MCDFFSFRTDGAGTPYYLNAEQRNTIKDDDADSHTFIAHFFGFKYEDEDMLNAYEYNPLTKQFTIDRMNNKDDSEQAREFCESLDWKTIVPELNIKPIAHPFMIERGEVTANDVELLKQWASVWDSVGASVGASVGDSVRDSVRDSVGASVWDSVWAYSSSFFTLKKWLYIDHTENTNPFQPYIDLWESGLVPSFDGKTWRLHAGTDAKIVYEWRPEK